MSGKTTALPLAMRDVQSMLAVSGDHTEMTGAARPDRPWLRDHLEVGLTGNAGQISAIRLVHSIRQAAAAPAGERPDPLTMFGHEIILTGNAEGMLASMSAREVFVGGQGRHAALIDHRIWEAPASIAAKLGVVRDMVDAILGDRPVALRPVSALCARPESWAERYPDRASNAAPVLAGSTPQALSSAGPAPGSTRH